ncbi:MAG: chemotaxis protein CheW [Pseudomonadota bacterium]
MFDAVETTEEVVEDQAHEQLVFRVADMLLAIPVLQVREIFDRTPLLSLPQAPPEVLGMIDVRSRSIAVIDFSQKLGHGPMEAHEGSRIVVLECNALSPDEDDDAEGSPDDAQLLAILTDGVVGVTALEQADDQHLPTVGERWDATCMTNLGRLPTGEVVIRLDLEVMFGGDDYRVFSARA